jgi:16S rRNA (cytidine1402-2'-O)-methyltransferase
MSTTASSSKGTLFLIPSVLAPDTEDKVITPQIREVLSKTQYYLVENVRTARRFISSLKTGQVIEQLTFFELDKNTPQIILEKNFWPLLKGHDMGVLSEAGCPGVADPGAAAVALAHRKGIQVVPLVGPSSILLALMGSGFSGQSFTFHGYLPIDKAARAKAIKTLEKDAALKKQTQIFMETPFRNDSFLTDLLQTCNPDTLLCIAANVTGEGELIKTRTIKEWRNNKPALQKIPVIYLIYAVA